MSFVDELQKLQSLREQGALTDEEFNQAKKRLLDGADPYAPGASVPPRGHAQPQGDSGLHQLRRSTSDRWIGGVCGGLAAITAIPAWLWRILFVLAILLHGLGALLYVLMWIFVPLQTQAVASAPPSPPPAAPTPPPSVEPQP